MTKRDLAIGGIGVAAAVAGILAVTLSSTGTDRINEARRASIGTTTAEAVSARSRSVASGRSAVVLNHSDNLACAVKVIAARTFLSIPIPADRKRDALVIDPRNRWLLFVNRKLDPGTMLLIDLQRELATELRPDGRIGAPTRMFLGKGKYFIVLSDNILDTEPEDNDWQAVCTIEYSPKR